MTLQEQYLTELYKLDEATRNQLIAQSRNVDKYKDQSRGATRMDRKKYTKVATVVKAYNEINMNDVFKKDILQINIPVVGETDEYTVTIKMEGVVAEIQKNIKNNSNKLEFRTIIQSLTKIFNTADVYIKCTCPDFKYRFAHHMIVNGMSVDDTASDPGPGKGVANPNDSMGRGCKHCLQVLANMKWLMLVASTLNNYIHFLSEKKPEIFLKLVFPKLYGVPAEEADENGIVEDNEDLWSGKDLIDTINTWAKNRGKIQKGSNINPVYADKLSKEQNKSGGDDDTAEV